MHQAKIAYLPAFGRFSWGLCIAINPANTVP